MAAYCAQVAEAVVLAVPVLQLQQAAVVAQRLIQLPLLPVGLRQAQRLEPADFLVLVGSLVQLERQQVGL